MALSLGVKHRVSVDKACDIPPGPTNAEDIDAFTFLPNHDDFDLEFSRMQDMVARILVQNFDALNHLEKRLTWHIPHAFSEEMNEKSTIVGLGVLEGNPSSTPDTIDILQNLMAYVPFVNGVAMPVPCHGDGGTVASIAKAKRGRIMAELPEYYSGGLVEAPQEFHKEGILLKVILIL